MDIYEKIASGAYKNTLPYPGSKDPDKTAKRAAYRVETARLEAALKADLEDEHGVTGNPKADKCWEIAWERGHSSGYNDVACVYEDIVELIK